MADFKVPTVEEIKIFHALRLIPARILSVKTDKFQRYASNFELGDNGVLYMLNDGMKIKLLENDAEKHSAFENEHNDVHLGLKEIIKQVEKKSFWFGMKQDIRKWLESCDICAEKEKECVRRRLVVLDHAYCRKLKDDSQIDKPTDSKSESQSNMERILSMDTRIETDASESSQENETLDSCFWDHDYVADKLTLRRNLYSFLNADEEKQPNKTALENDLKPSSVSELSRLSLKETLWKPVKHSVNYHTDFIPSPEDNVFTSLLGLEMLCNMWDDAASDFNYYNFEKSLTPVLPCARCVKCGTDVSQSWNRTAENKVICVSCLKKTLQAENSKRSIISFNQFANRYTDTLHQKIEDIKKQTGAVEERKQKMEEKRKEAMSEFLKMRKLAMFKANHVTRTLLSEKGVKSRDIPLEEIFTRKIRKMMASSTKRTLTPSSHYKIISSLEKKRSLQNYLQVKIAERKQSLTSSPLKGIPVHFSLDNQQKRFLHNMQHRKKMQETRGAISPKYYAVKKSRPQPNKNLRFKGGITSSRIEWSKSTEKT